MDSSAAPDSSAQDVLLLNVSASRVAEVDARRWARCKLYSRAALITLYVTSAALFGIIVWQLYVRHAERTTAAVAAAGAAVMLAVPLSLFDVHAHLQNYISPLQRHYIRIMGMVPIYAIESWLALAFREQRVYLETARESYEAFVIYSIFRLYIEALGERAAVVALLERKGGAADFLFGLRFVLPSSWRWPLGEVFVRRCELAVLQYVALRVTLALVALIAEWAGVLCEGYADYSHCALPWISAAVLLSQSCAMYGLLAFYHELAAELELVRPLAKLLVVKAVVFFSFAQGIALNLLFYAGVIAATVSYTASDLNASLQNFLVCWEMLLAAVAHHFFFSRSDFKGGLLPGLPGGGRLPAAAALIAAMPHDVVRESARAGEEVALSVGAGVVRIGTSAADAVSGAVRAATEAVRPPSRVVWLSSSSAEAEAACGTGSGINAAAAAAAAETEPPARAT